MRVGRRYNGRPLAPEHRLTDAEREPAPPTQSYWTTRPRRLREDWRLPLVLAGVLLALYLPGLGGYGLYDPWETHYGEVARNMVETGNYIDPWWGSPWDPQDVKREREGFYSKPLLIMWMMAAGMELWGFNELGVRFFFPFLAILALLAIYLAVSRFHNRRAGVIAVAALASAPIYAFMSRQAVTDGPMVALMTAGVMSLCIGLFACDEDEPAGRGLYVFTIGLVLLVALGQLWTMLPMDRSPDVVRPYPGSGGPHMAIQWWLQEVATVGVGKGWVLALLLLPAVAWAGLRVAAEKRRRMLYIFLFYVCCGLCVPAKGWLAWAPMGGAILGYMAVTGEWRLFGKVNVPTGLLIVFVCGHPWIIAMLGGHHPGWADRFIKHDHINRLFAGVHSIDDGAFEYFIQWIGYGLYPLIGILPAAIARVFGWLRPGTDGHTSWSRRQRFELFVVLWAVFGFFLFSKSSTKFHHYIFPVVPALAILVGLYVEDLLSGRLTATPSKRVANAVLLAASALVVVWVGQDLYRPPAAYGQGGQQLVNSFTYKYDREWPKWRDDDAIEKLEGEEKVAAEQDKEWLAGMSANIGWAGGAAALGMLFMGFFGGGRRRYGVFVVGGASIWLAGWCLHDYLPKVGVHWSQKGMWDRYYELCTKETDEAAYRETSLLTAARVPSKLDMFPRAHCKEPIVAFRTNWRGETYYSGNTVIPCPETKHLKPFLDLWGNDKPFFLFTEKNRVKSELDPNLPAHLKKAYTQVYGREGANGEGLKFSLLRFDPPPPDQRPKAEKRKRAKKRDAKKDDENLGAPE